MITDWIMIAITTVYVVATIVICVSNKRSADAAKKQTEEMINQYREANRPYIIVKFEIVRSGLLCFVVENIGNMPAYKLHINLCREFIDNMPDEFMKERMLEFIDAQDIYLAPKQKMFITIDGQLAYNEIAKVPAIFIVRYNELYNERFVIDLQQYKFMLSYVSAEEDMAQYLKKLQENLNKQGKELLKVVRELAKNNVNK